MPTRLPIGAGNGSSCKKNRWKNTKTTEAGITKRASCQTFRHSFTTHLLESGYDIGTI
ncbi:MAG: hypothetical protein E3K29_02515 [Candidatus Brocadia sp.]|nr:hypothetical protein [Candidatus Brocadia sp.]